MRSFWFYLDSLKGAHRKLHSVIWITISFVCLALIPIVPHFMYRVYMPLTQAFGLLLYTLICAHCYMVVGKRSLFRSISLAACVMAAILFAIAAWIFFPHHDPINDQFGSRVAFHNLLSSPRVECS